MQVGSPPSLAQSGDDENSEDVETVQRKLAGGRFKDSASAFAITTMKEPANTMQRLRTPGRKRVSLHAVSETPNGPANRGTQSRRKSGGNANFLNNVVDFLCNLYGKDAVGRSDQEETQTTSDDNTGEWAQRTPVLPYGADSPRQPRGTTGGETAQPCERPPLTQRPYAHTHYGFIDDRSRILSAACMGRSVTEDKLQFLVEKILDGYRRISDKSRAPSQRRVSLRDTCSNVSMFVNRAVDSFVAREASFSQAETRSNQSILSTAYDNHFQTPLTFRTFSDIGDVDEESEAMLKPDFHAVLPTFERKAAESGVSVSAPMRMQDDQHMVDDGVATESECESSPRELKRRQRGANTRTLVSFLPTPSRQRALAPCSWAEMNMSLQSNGVESLCANDSWETMPDRMGSPSECFPSGRWEPEMDVAVLVNSEEVERCVLVSVEGRFRMHITSLKNHELLVTPPPLLEEERSMASRRTLLPAVNARTTSPMMQNIIEFFSY